MKYSDVMKHDQPWYSLKTVVYDKQNKLYEERIIVVRASSEDEAYAKGRQEVNEYVKGLNMDFTGYIEAYHIFDPELVENGEVYSLMRKSDLGYDEYVKQFVATGNEVIREFDTKSS